MPPQDLLIELQKRPFRGLRIHVSDGTIYEIRHPDLVMVGMGSAVIGIKETDVPLPVYTRYVVVALSHIVKLEPMEAPTTTSN